MAFNNLLYYPGHTHSPLRLTRLMDLLPTLSIPSSLPPTQDTTQDTPTIIDPFCFYALTKNPAETGSTRSWLVAVLLIGEDRQGTKEDEMIKVATGGLRLEFERLLYPGAIIQITSRSFECAPRYESYTHFSEFQSSYNVHHPSQQSSTNDELAQHDHDDEDAGDESHDENNIDVSGKTFIPFDPTPSCYGQLELSFTESNLRKGMMMMGDDTGKGYTSHPHVESFTTKQRSQRMTEIDGNDGKLNIETDINNAINDDNNQICTNISQRHTVQHPTSTSSITNHFPTWQGNGWSILNKTDPRYRPFKDLIETRMVALEKQLMAGDDEGMEEVDDWNEMDQSHE